MADMMERVLRRVEQEQGTSLLNEESWNLLGDYIATVRGTIVVQKDMSDLLGLLLSTPKVEPAAVEEPVVTVETEQMLLQDAPPQHQGRDDNIYLRSEPGHPQPRHPSALPHRPRPPAAIRKITLGESGQPRPRNPRTMRESSAEDTDGSDHRSSPEVKKQGKKKYAKTETLAILSGMSVSLRTSVGHRVAYTLLLCVQDALRRLALILEQDLTTGEKEKT